MAADEGAGVMKPEPGTEAVAVAGTCPLGMLPMWQLSHFVLLGMCEPMPAGEVGGMTTMRPMPKKLPAPTPGPWQTSQPEVMPEWLKAELLKRAPLGTGVAAMLDPGPTWQVSQPAEPIGTWLEGGATMLKPAAGLA